MITNYVRVVSIAKTSVRHEPRELVSIDAQYFSKEFTDPYYFLVAENHAYC
jgi:hypothetical protein